MPQDQKHQGIVRDEKGQEQPIDKDRAQTATKTEPGHMPSQQKARDDETRKKTS